MGNTAPNSKQAQAAGRERSSAKLKPARFQLRRQLFNLPPLKKPVIFVINSM